MLDLIRLFTLSVETGSFSEAGRRMGLQPSSVSRRISELEDELSARLFNRTTRKLSLTEAGQIYYSRVRAIVEQIDEAASAISQVQSAPRGSLRVTVPSSFGRLQIAPILPEFIASFPEIQIEILSTDHCLDLVEHNIDVAIRIMPPEDSLLICRKLSAAPLIMCASSRYLAEFGTPASISDLQLHRLLAYRHSEGNQSWKLRRRDRVVEIPVSGTLSADDDDILYQATLLGSGISIQPLWRAARDLVAGRLVRIFEGYDVTSSSFDTAVYVLYLQRSGLAPKVRSFVDFLIAKLEKSLPASVRSPSSALDQTSVK